MLHKPYKVIDNCKIYGNNHYVPLIYGYELTDKEKKEFDYLNDDNGIFQEDNFTGFRYKGNTYSLDEFMRDDHKVFKGLADGYTNDTFFSGIIVKFTDNSDFIKVYTFIS